MKIVKFDNVQEIRYFQIREIFGKNDKVQLKHGFFQQSKNERIWGQEKQSSYKQRNEGNLKKRTLPQENGTQPVARRSNQTSGIK